MGSIGIFCGYLKPPKKASNGQRAPILYSHKKTWKVAGTDFVGCHPPKKDMGGSRSWFCTTVMKCLDFAGFLFTETRKRKHGKNRKHKKTLKKNTLIGSCIKSRSCVNSFDQAIFGIPIKSRIVPPKSHLKKIIRPLNLSYEIRDWSPLKKQDKPVQTWRPQVYLQVEVPRFLLKNVKNPMFYLGGLDYIADPQPTKVEGTPRFA